MKKNVNLILICFSAIVITVSCKKYTPGYVAPPLNRNVRFQLYTNQDFSSDNSLITFSIFIRNANHVIFDSSLAPMLIKDIPGGSNKLVIEKKIPVNEQADLAVGFRYTIQNVGTSGFIDTIRAGNSLKVLDYDFH